MKGGMVRVQDCEQRGQHLEAANDDDLFQQAREHVHRGYPEMELGDTQAREIVAQGAYDK